MFSNSTTSLLVLCYVLGIFLSVKFHEIYPGYCLSSPPRTDEGLVVRIGLLSLERQKGCCKDTAAILAESLGGYSLIVKVQFRLHRMAFRRRGDAWR